MAVPIYCPICTHKLVIAEEGGRMRPTCPNCGYVHYVNPVPTVGVMIEMDGGLVLIKRARPPHQGEWTFPSGYVEADERLEEAAIREAEEETGLQVEILELLDVNSYPEGPPASGIMIFYRARPIGGRLQAGDDASEARVFPLGELPILPFRTHREVLARWLMTQEHRLNGERIAPIESFFSIRPAAPRDAQQIIELIRMMPINHALQSADWDKALIRAREMPTLQIFVATLDVQPDLIIGGAVFSIVHALTEHYGWINDLAVLPSYRRRGIGTALLKAVMQRALDLNLMTLLVNTERANPAAQTFLQKAGFNTFPIARLKM
ncbi:MAG: GNAT family N-acetyltransferase [Anaerolineae bacterium]|jgi:ADP-ribose pyrophosphatase YjhB (NUDIX family)/GNAT superfamily N-acetyltransferase|nr:GNAT family N-acetyltransferase [Anaerolineae bacterium]